MKTDLHANDMSKRGHSKPEDREANFFKDMSQELINRLYELYEKDFIMFGYEFDINQYDGIKK